MAGNKAAESRSRRFWSVGRKVTAAFVAAIVGGFIVIMGLQAKMQYDDAVRLATHDARVKTDMLANATKTSFVAGDGASIETEFMPLADSHEVQLASLRAASASSTLADFSNPRFAKYDLKADQDLVEAVLAGKGAQTRSANGHIVVTVPVVTGKSNRLVGALQIAWNLDQQIDAIAAQMRNQIAICLIALVVQIALLNVLLGRIVIRPLRAMSAAMAKLADGDTAVEVPGNGRSDEIGAMAGSVTVFRDNARAIERMHAAQAEADAKAEQAKRAALLDLADRFQGTVKRLVEGIAESAAGMADSADRMAMVVGEASSQTRNVARESDDIQSNVRSAAAAATELASSIGGISEQVGHSARIAGEAVSHTDRTNATVQGLIANAERIGQVVGLIHAIAKQTNLLALNATIEAARAGEAGKGFAVVATEVKGLADQTARATDEIAAQVNAMQSVTREAADAIGTIGATITEIDGISGTITQSVQEQNSATQEIARAVEMAALGTQDVSATIAALAHTAESAGSTALGVQDAARGLSGQTRALAAEVERFLTEVRQQATGDVKAA
ncbi:methyl-accepting chemotaxis protein [Azospirillum lipoferum]|uniref:HAMP domain-containing protein n=1 Tax=Azospirillum lipoferum TaxID=193 RepID=A0A5A9GSM8_AZOLI|nr:MULTISPECIES: HAMP domain-containing methyl-accepting chemotaxis protein [Azospirillum]KAA0596795.1 HAMP domain-containing protein [Azospirillum lipoferum]MCP1610827.1 methyl-accepting chemotaxis protein [Azospirillum lipoferum]MDW5537730.1 HAMP domain-containing methyl-accepting chemotaxis protein [Azospirillum sp. NL1]